MNDKIFGLKIRLEFAVKSLKQRRNSYDIFADILKFCLKKKAPTRVIKELGLSYANGEKCLALLLNLGFLKKNSTKYITTLKGQEFLEKYNALYDLLTDDSHVSLKNISLIRKMETRRFR